MLFRLGVLSTRKPASSSTALTFQASGTPYYLVKLTDDLRVRLDNHISWGQSAVRLLSSRIGTGAQYVKCWQDIDEGLIPLIGAEGADGYTRRWLKRAWMRWMIKRNKATINWNQLPVLEYTRCFPDEHGLMARLLTDPDKSWHENSITPLHVAFQYTNYEDDADLFSMHCCLLDDWDAQTVLRSKPVDWIDRNAAVMRRRLDEWYEREGLWPHPGRFFVSCVDLP